jgi:hypothetical protein
MKSTLWKLYRTPLGALVSILLAVALLAGVAAVVDYRPQTEAEIVKERARKGPPWYETHALTGWMFLKPPK